MIIENNKGIKKEFKLLFKIEKDNNIYLIYQDNYSKQVYAGKQNKDNLKKLNDKEVDLINNLLKKIEE